MSKSNTFKPDAWRTSTRSNDVGQCVEVAVTPAAVGVRDSKDRSAGNFTVDRDVWSQFIRTVKTGTLDA